MFWKVYCEERPDMMGFFKKKHIAEWYADWLKRMRFTTEISIVFMQETDE